MQPAVPGGCGGGGGLGAAAGRPGAVCEHGPCPVAHGPEAGCGHFCLWGRAGGVAELCAVDVHAIGRAGCVALVDGDVLRGAAGGIPRTGAEGGDPVGERCGFGGAGAWAVPVRRGGNPGPGGDGGGRRIMGGRCGRGWWRRCCGERPCGTGRRCWRGRERGGSCGGGRPDARGAGWRRRRWGRTSGGMRGGRSWRG